METHKSRLVLLCCFYGEQSIDLKRKKPKVNINFHVKLNDYYFGDNDDGIHPPNLCLKCKQKLETLNQKFKNFLRKTPGGEITA